MNYLSKDGLTYLINKIKSFLPKKTSELENDTDFVTKAEMDAAIANAISIALNGEY